MRKIDRTPPPLTGNANKDLQAMREYEIYLREQMNFILTQIYKEIEKEEGNQ